MDQTKPTTATRLGWTTSACGPSTIRWHGLWRSRNVFKKRQTSDVPFPEPHICASSTKRPRSAVTPVFTKVFKSQYVLYLQSVHIYIDIYRLSLLSTFYFFKYPSWEIHVSYYTREPVTQTNPSRLVCLVYDHDRKLCKYLIRWERQSHMRN